MNRDPGPEDDHLGLGDRALGVVGRAHVIRRDPHPVDAVRLRDPALPGDLGPVVEAGMEGQRRGGRGHDPAAHREDAVHLAHRLLEVAVLELHQRGEEQVADRVPAEAGARLRVPRRDDVLAARRARPGTREPVLEQAAHERLGVRERDDAVADVAHGRDAQLLAQHAGRAAVVRDGHDRGEVRGVLLEPAEERRQARPAAQRHDPRAAREEPLLVDDLDHRLVAVPQGERVDQRPHEAVGTDEEQRRAERAEDQPAELVRERLEGERVEDLAQQVLGRQRRRQLAQDVRDAEHEDEQPDEREEEPPLDADPDGQPAALVHRSSSRWNTATDPKSRSRSQVASSSEMTIERWKPPVQPIAMVRRVLPSST